jgi:hypothetical protein
LQAQVDANDWEVEPHLWKANETKTENHELIMVFDVLGTASLPNGH